MGKALRTLDLFSVSRWHEGLGDGGYREIIGLWEQELILAYSASDKGQRPWMAAHRLDAEPCSRTQDCVVANLRLLLPYRTSPTRGSLTLDERLRLVGSIGGERWMSRAKTWDRSRESSFDQK